MDKRGIHSRPVKLCIEVVVDPPCIYGGSKVHIFCLAAQKCWYIQQFTFHSCCNGCDKMVSCFDSKTYLPILFISITYFWIVNCAIC
jgi:hypothetical protein